MIRTNTTFKLLQAITAVVTLAIILWFTGVPFFRTAEAANVISFSNTLSDSEPAAVANHTLSFVTPNGLDAGQIITIDFGASFSGVGSLDALDVDLNVNGAEESLIDGAASGADWGVTAAGTLLEIESGTDVIADNATVTIEVGNHASTGGAGFNQLINPAVGSYEITVSLSGSDNGTTEVAIVNVVTVTAVVETVFNFTVEGVDAGLSINEDTTTSTTTPTSIPFGVLEADTPSTAAQDLLVETNAANGFVVTVQTDQQLTSATGADIDGFTSGTYLTVPLVWESSVVSLGNENTYGHWGITTDDDSLTPSLTDEFGVGDVEAYSKYVSASTTPVEIFRNDGPTNETLQGIGTTRVGYTVEITGLQEAGDDYTATLTYVATPVF